MAETRATAATNEALASLRNTSNHNTKDIQEIQTIQEIHTRTLNEMNQQLASLLQRLGASDQRGVPNSGVNRSFSSLAITLSHPVRLEFPRFFGEDLASWVYKANQYFKYFNIPVEEKLMLALFHMDEEALIWFQDSEETRVFIDWESLVQALHIKFGSNSYDDQMKTLTRLR